MKILKPGKIEQRKFACGECGCIFVADSKEVRYSVGTDYVLCPCCGTNRNLTWKSGEPYEEPTPMRTDWVRFQRLLYDMPGYRGSTGEGADYLIANGVTFGERRKG